MKQVVIIVPFVVNLRVRKNGGCQLIGMVKFELGPSQITHPLCK